MNAREAAAADPEAEDAGRFRRLIARFAILQLARREIAGNKDIAARTGLPRSVRASPTRSPGWATQFLPAEEKYALGGRAGTGQTTWRA
jgi:hypothetical protein